MTNSTEDYYIQRKAGDPWTVEDFHELQKMIKQDIQNSITTAIHELQHVDKAGDADKFGGETPAEYAKAIVDRVLAELPKRTGYRMVFKDLKVGELSKVKHE
jgi:siroheme synthase (precorrin-2 oxidase/ferrochelatase)